MIDVRVWCGRSLFFVELMTLTLLFAFFFFFFASSSLALHLTARAFIWKRFLFTLVSIVYFLLTTSILF